MESLVPAIFCIIGVGIVALLIYGLYLTFSRDKSQPEQQPVLVVNQPATTQARKGNWFLILGLLVAIITICCIGVLLASPQEVNITNIFSGNEVEYVITGSAREAFISYFNADGGTEQVEARVPWSKKFSMKDGAPVSIVAQNQGTGTITCEIRLNGNKWKSATTTAQYGVVTCAGWIGLD
jgi:hypothetical protein